MSRRNIFFSLGILVLIIGIEFGESAGPSHNNNNNNKPTKQVSEERNKKIVLDFYQQLFGDKNLNAIDRYIDDRNYVQHNPNVADGKQAFKAAASTWFTSGSRRERVDVRHISAEKDLVWLHVKNGKNAIVEIFRLNNRGKITEHWDVIQEIPNQSANSHPMF